MSDRYDGFVRDTERAYVISLKRRRSAADRSLIPLDLTNLRSLHYRFQRPDTTSSEPRPVDAIVSRPGGVIQVRTIATDFDVDGSYLLFGQFIWNPPDSGNPTYELLARLHIGDQPFPEVPEVPR